MGDEAQSPLYPWFAKAIITIYSLLDDFAFDFRVFDPLAKWPAERPINKHHSEIV